jgi:hypothetical protein
MRIDEPGTPKVIDLARYRAQRESRPAPLVDGRLTHRLTLISPFPGLTGQQVAHRRRMLDHMRSTARCTFFNRNSGAASQKLHS